MENTIRLVDENKLKEIQASIDKAKLEEMVNKPNYDFRAKLRRLLGTRNAQESVTFAKTMRENAQARKTIKAAASTANLMSYINNYQFLYAPSIYIDRLQDYLPTTVISKGLAANVAYGNVYDPEGGYNAINQGEPKNEIQVNITSAQNQLYKLAITLLYTDEMLRIFGEDIILNYFQLVIETKLEDILHEYLVANTNFSPFDTTPYAASVSNANFIDVVNLMIEQLNETIYYASPRIKYVADTVILPNKYYEKLKVTKDSIGRRLYNNWGEAFGDGINVLNHKLTSSSNIERAIVLPSQAHSLVIYDDVIMNTFPVADENADKNLYRLNIELYFTPIYVTNFSDTAFIGRETNLNIAINAIKTS